MIPSTKRTAKAARRLAGRTVLRGTSATCDCCGRSFRRLMSYRGRPRVRCPWCGSLERHRAVARLLRALTPARTLEIAPDPILEGAIRGGTVITLDLLAAADVRGDLERLPFANSAFDLVICSHVLEHVPDDGAAITELARVLAPGGAAIVLVPSDQTRPRTFEDWSITSADERAGAFGQADHVRVYGQDLGERLCTAPWKVTEVADSLLADGEQLFLCSLPADAG